MRYGKIKYFDIANGSGVRTSLFVSGCYRKCPGCFSPETWDFKFGSDFTAEVEEEILNSLAPSYIAGLSVIGGEPIESRYELIPFFKKVRERYPEKTIWLFTGYSFEELMTLADLDDGIAEILEMTDVLKAGAFMKELYEPGLIFRGSRNQELIDMNKTRETGDKVLWRKEEI